MNEQESRIPKNASAALKKELNRRLAEAKKSAILLFSQDDHFEECFKFAEAAGFMSAEEAIMARKTGGKGPGNCKGRKNAKTFVIILLIKKSVLISAKNTA